MLICPAIGDTDPIRCRAPSPGGQFSGNIISEAMRGQCSAPIDTRTARSVCVPVVAEIAQRLAIAPAHVLRLVLAVRRRSADPDLPAEHRYASRSRHRTGHNRAVIRTTFRLFLRLRSVILAAERVGPGRRSLRCFRPTDRAGQFGGRVPANGPRQKIAASCRKDAASIVLEENETPRKGKGG